MMVAMSEEEMAARRCSTSSMVMPVAARAIMRWAPRSKESTATVYSGGHGVHELGLLGGGREDAGHVRVGEDVLVWAAESDS